MTDNKIKSQTVEALVEQTLDILDRFNEIHGLDDDCLETYGDVCRKMPAHIREGRLKIAVVGVIKSGKSTFVNSIAGSEIVKRGAGVVTCITTRIRKGRKNRASLYFKSWDEINLQLAKALHLFPGYEVDKNNSTGFDLRRKKDREELADAYETLIHNLPGLNDESAPQILMIRHALAGYDACHSFTGADENLLCFESRNFAKHKEYTADPDNAFYLKDVCLEIFGRAIDPDIEIADCQGADSTDPAQLSRILSYLETSSLIIYCISSRTGLRQADIQFLTRIRKLGLIENVIFVNNCDLTEHENLEDLKKIESAILQDLNFLEIKPRLFSFSALYNLFSKLGSRLGPRDAGRLELWRRETDMVRYCDDMTEKFNILLEHGIEKYRYELLVSNHLKRLGMIIEELDKRSDILLDLLSSDAEKENQAVKALEELDHDASRLELIVNNSIEGAVTGLKDEIESSIREFFVRDISQITSETCAFIDKITIDIDKYRSVTQTSGFNRILYLMFQDFKNKFDLYVIEDINPRVKKFIESQDSRIAAYFQSLLDSYRIDLVKSGRFDQFEFIPFQGEIYNGLADSVDIAAIKRILGLTMPDPVLEARYSGRVKAGTFTQFTMKTISQILSCVFDRKARFSFSPALETAGLRIRTETKKDIRHQFELYGETLLNIYFTPLIEAATRDFREKIQNRFDRYRSFRKETDRLLNMKQTGKKDQSKALASIKDQIQQVSEQIYSACSLSWDEV